MWAENAVFYQIYPLGLCGAPTQNDGQLVHRILKLKDWAGHIERLGANAVYLSPVIASSFAHRRIHVVSTHVSCRRV